MGFFCFSWYNGNMKTKYPNKRFKFDANTVSLFVCKKCGLAEWLPTNNKYSCKDISHAPIKMRNATAEETKQGYYVLEVAEKAKSILDDLYNPDIVTDIENAKKQLEVFGYQLDTYNDNILYMDLNSCWHTRLFYNNKEINISKPNVDDLKKAINNYKIKINNEYLNEHFTHNAVNDLKTLNEGFKVRNDADLEEDLQDPVYRKAYELAAQDTEDVVVIAQVQKQIKNALS